MKNLVKCMHEEHEGAISFEMVIILILFCLLVYAIVTVPIPSLEITDEVGHPVSFTEYIVFKVDQLRNYIVNNNVNVSVWQ